MKILFVHEIFPPQIAGGGEIIAAKTVEMLSRNHDVRVLTTGDPSILSWKGIPTKRLPIHRYAMNMAAPWIAKHARWADIIHCVTFNAALPSWIAAKITNKPVVCTVMGVYGPSWKQMAGPILGRLFQLTERIQVSRSYDKLLFLSDFSREFAIKELHVSAERADVTRPGVDTERFKPLRKGNYVLFAGRLVKQKGIRYIAEAAKRLPKIKFKIAGDGPERPLLDNIPNVELLGNLPHGKKLYDLYGHALILCMPSVGEGLGIMAQEAMAAGCAVISTVPIDFHGAHIKPTVEDLVQALKRLSSDRKFALQCGKKNRALAKQYTWQSYINKLESVYADLKTRS